MSITLTNLVKDYVSPDGTTQRIIDVPQFALRAGEQMALMGASGSGKTTLLHLIAGILTPDSGTVDFEVKPGEVVRLSDLAEAERDVFRGAHIGYIFQTHHLLPGFTAIENVLLGMSFTGRPADREWAVRLLNEVGLSDRLNYKPGKLSVGQQQRVAVARALANRPKLVLADEPTGALDGRTAEQVIALIRQLCTEVGAALLIVTHDAQIAAKFDRQASLNQLNRAATGAVAV